MRTATLLLSASITLLPLCSCESASESRTKETGAAERKQYPAMGKIERNDPALDGLTLLEALRFDRSLEHRGEVFGGLGHGLLLLMVAIGRTRCSHARSDDEFETADRESGGDDRSPAPAVGVSYSMQPNARMSYKTAA